VQWAKQHKKEQEQPPQETFPEYGFDCRKNTNLLPSGTNREYWKDSSEDDEEERANDDDDFG
jgi:hypothetical protein